MTYLQIHAQIPIRKKMVKKTHKVGRVAISSLIHPPCFYRLGKGPVKIIKLFL